MDSHTKSASIRRHIKRYRLRYGAALGLTATAISLSNPIAGGAIKAALYIMPLLGM